MCKHCLVPIARTCSTIVIHPLIERSGDRFGLSGVGGWKLVVRGLDVDAGAWALGGEDRVRLFDGRFESGASAGSPGEVVEIREGRAVHSRGAIRGS